MTRTERLEAIATLAGSLRSAQRRYFRLRESASLIEAKGLEKRLDGLLAELGADTPHNPEGGTHDDAAHVA